MSGKITFQFDDGHRSHYEIAFPLFKKYGFVGNIGIVAGRCSMSDEEILQMQSAGWEVLSHACEHKNRMTEELDSQMARHEIVDSKQILQARGFNVKGFLTPMSQCHKKWHPMLRANYEHAFTVYTNSSQLPIEKLVMERPVNRFELHRAGMAGKTLEELKAYVDYVAENDAWLVFYDHDIGVGKNITAERLDALLTYCEEKQIAVVTSAQALDAEICTTMIIHEGFDGKSCIVHARGAVNDNYILLTAQYLNVAGSDDFECLHTNLSRDGGKTWTGFVPDEAFKSVTRNGIRTTTCDATPFYHKKTGKFLVTGHTVDYFEGENHPVDSLHRHRVTPYAVFDVDTGKFGKLYHVEMPDKVKYCDCGSGCSQCLELENGDMLIPVAFREKQGDKVLKGKVAVMRCSFDGKELKVVAIGNDIAVENTARGIGEASVMEHNGKYYLTIRDDACGYLAVSDDGINYSEPIVWCWTNGEQIPTYNTQSHWLTLHGEPYLVYTRKAKTNDHVFRHRAPLFVAKFNAEKMALEKETEFIAVPERGARLGNFGTVSQADGSGLVIVSEWMQPMGCDLYGSNNAVWLSFVR